MMVRNDDNNNNRYTALSVAIVAYLSVTHLLSTVYSFQINPFINTVQNYHHHHHHAPLSCPSWQSTIVPTTTSTTSTTNDRTVVTRCYGRKRGKLNQNVSSPPSKRTKGGGGTSETNEVAVSSSLAEWAANARSSSSTSTAPSQPSVSNTDYENDDDEDDVASTFTPFSSSTKGGAGGAKKKTKGTTTNTSPRRERQAKRQQMDSKRRSALISRTNTLRDLLDGKQLDIPTILMTIQSIITEFGPGEKGSDPKDHIAATKRFLKSKTSTSLDYTLAWVGSDDAICHVGTGLHKVPLARLQDIYLTIGRVGLTNNAWRMMEVIRILGPFPNVRNTLMGRVMDVSKGSSSSSSATASIKIRYDSIVDGVGKELNAGTEEDTRFVSLDVYYADEEMIVCVVPNDGDSGGKGGGALDVVAGGGSNVLLFLREDKLEEKLEMARVAG